MVFLYESITLVYLFPLTIEHCLFHIGFICIYSLYITRFHNFIALCAPFINCAHHPLYSYHFGTDECITLVYFSLYIRDLFHSGRFTFLFFLCAPFIIFLRSSFTLFISFVCCYCNLDLSSINISL